MIKLTRLSSKNNAQIAKKKEDIEKNKDDFSFLGFNI
jgi:hypothetical protein